ncbi:hypothetical protein N7492_005393 [Penicillium capsulatum]|uniref:Zn(2)-C6 fungal-type domain-containing protein n=1 Tax=Penicillium capsulatum TaxID=69766 RepID=A0A9W9I9H5_9EURO|nr:hypothetical protein N7492_005393 [Penicillium capsulatum]
MADDNDVRGSTIGSVDDHDQPRPPARNPQRKSGKKRTKTGCLTCRKRRIKCGEEKPTCSNCVKSKRTCEGYAQRVVFKNPLGLLGGFPPRIHDPYAQQNARAPSLNEYGVLPAQEMAAAAQYPMLAPRPMDSASMGYQSSLSEDPQSAGISQFQYPAPLAQGPSNLWPGQAYAQAPQGTFANQFEDEALDEELYQQTFPHKDVPFNYPGPSELPHQLVTPGDIISLPHSQVFYQDNEAEDYYDVDSDEEMPEQVQAEGFNQLTLIMASANRNDGRLRTFTSYLNEPNILATYQPTMGSSPLNNPKTARIFAHFIHSTGPSLSIFERHQTDASVVLGVSVPPSQQGLWTYTLPLKALENRALLQAILAVSSLHIAYLQQASTTVSLKHYHYALKRIGHAVGLPLRRKQIGTLAATQLLAYYEVIAADHTKWNSHLAGAAQLIKEIDFASNIRDLRVQRRRINEQRMNMEWADPSMSFYMFGSDASEDDPFAEKESTIDEELISVIMGRAVNFDEFGYVEEGHTPTPKHFSRKDIENFRTQCDLYWWFSKQDLFHSLVSGEKLL